MTRRRESTMGCVKYTDVVAWWEWPALIVAWLLMLFWICLLCASRVVGRGFRWLMRPY